MLADIILLRQTRRNHPNAYVTLADHPDFPGERVVVRQYETYADADREARTLRTRNPVIYRREKFGWLKAS